MRLISVGKRYGLRQPWIVRDVSHEVAAGRLIRLEGPNGSGKSTLLRVIAGVLVPSAGRVTGRPHTGYVPERFPAALAFSAREYLHHMGRIHGLSPAAISAARRLPSPRPCWPGRACWYSMRRGRAWTRRPVGSLMRP